MGHAQYQAGPGVPAALVQRFEHVLLNLSICCEAVLLSMVSKSRREHTSLYSGPKRRLSSGNVFHSPDEAYRMPHPRALGRPSNDSASIASLRACPLEILFLREANASFRACKDVSYLGCYHPKVFDASRIVIDIRPVMFFVQP